MSGGSILRMALVGALAGCSFDSSGSSGTSLDDAGPNDGDGNQPGIDGRVFACADWTARHFDPCALEQNDEPLNLGTPGTYVYDTGTFTLIAPDGDVVPHTRLVIDDVMVIVNAAEIAISSDVTLRAEGPLALLLASTSTISIGGTIDVSSNAAGPGAGGNSIACGASNGTPGEDDSAGAAGGGGGGFGGNGGRGGDGDSDNSGGSPGTSVGGAPGTPVPVPVAVRGGCPGGRGGVGFGGASGAGSGGGAIELAAFQSIVVTGSISAGGAGGGGGDDSAGGGGGGSGGYIGLDAPAVDVSGAVIAANGGGGAGGGDATAGGGPGSDALVSATRAGGGLAGDGGPPGDPEATAGGRGGAGTVASGESVTDTEVRGGGGGGGGVGIILVFGASELTKPDSVISPAEQIVAP